MSGTNHDLDSDDGEEALEDGKEDFRDESGAWRRSSCNITETNGVEVADEFAGGAGVGERVPYEPPVGDVRDCMVEQRGVMIPLEGRYC